MTSSSVELMGGGESFLQRYLCPRGRIDDITSPLAGAPIWREKLRRGQPRWHPRLRQRREEY